MSHDCKLCFSVFCLPLLTDAVRALLDIGKIPFVVYTINSFENVSYVDVTAEGYGSGNKSDQIKEYFEEIAMLPEVEMLTVHDVPEDPSLEGDYSKDPQDSSKIVFNHRR
jgi:NDP-sugar pyrophosphorylase family protein